MAVSRRLLSVAFTLVLVPMTPSLLPAGSAATSQILNQANGPCLTTGEGFPGVTVDPECKPSSSPEDELTGTTDDSPLNTTAVSSGPSVVVNWTLPGNREGIAAFQVLRGATPSTLQEVWEGGVQDRSFTDAAAWSSGESVWYQVHAVDAYGQIIVESEPVRVTIKM